MQRSDLRKRKSKHDSEAAISKRITDYLISQDYGVIRVNSGMIAHKSYLSAYEIKNKTIQDNGKNTKILNKAWKNSGFSDLLLLKDSVSTYLEIKTATGKQSDKQKAFQEYVESFDCSYYIARSVDDVRALIQKEGI